MATRDRLRRLQKAMHGNIDSFELADGSRYWFDPAGACKELFGYWSASLRAVHREEPRPNPPEILKAVAGAADRERAFRQAYSQAPTLWCPLDTETLILRGELVPHSLMPGRDAEEPSPGYPNLSE
jgi:hypothetical protein